MTALSGAWLWFRDSSLVAVEHVTVTGVTGPDAGQIRSALRAAARNMATLDVRMDRLRSAVAPYPVVKDLRVSTQFPHGMRIRVIERPPVGAVFIGGRTTAVAADGTLLRDLAAPSSLALIPVRVATGGTRLTDPSALHALALLGAAPYQLLAKISQVTSVAPHGLVAQIRSGPTIYFGDSSDLANKWIAASEVLADPGSAGASYIDVTNPQRPVAGAGSSQGASGSVAGAGSSQGTSGSVAGAGSSQGTSGSAPASTAASSGPTTVASNPGAAGAGNAGAAAATANSGAAAAANAGPAVTAKLGAAGGDKPGPTGATANSGAG